MLSSWPYHCGLGIHKPSVGPGGYQDPRFRPDPPRYPYLLVGRGVERDTKIETLANNRSCTQSVAARVSCASPRLHHFLLGIQNLSVESKGYQDRDPGQTSSGTHRFSAGVSCSPPDSASEAPVPKCAAWDREDALLLLSAEAFDGIEALRMASEARLGAALRPLDDHGKGLSPVLAELAGAQAMCDSLRALEHQALLDLRRTIRKHPLGPWIRRTVGVGEKQGARLLAAIGDPRTRTTVSQLWAYCGYHVIPTGHTSTGTQGSSAGGEPSHAHDLPTGQTPRDTQDHFAGGDHSNTLSTSHVQLDTQERNAGGDSREVQGGVAPSRTKGKKSNWNSTAKMRAYLIAESCIKQTRSPYREVYDKARVKHATATHNVECRRCGPSGKPALVGSPLSLGHQHARGLRVVAKAILKDIWVEARRVDSE